MSIEVHQSQASMNLSDEMRYAETVSRAALLPTAYRGKPADILIATGLGNAIGIAPAQALYEIYVVNGRPSPSANLMAAVVRRAGHKLRIQGDDRQCTATLIRADDPDFPMSATWTIEKAQAAKLTGKDTWKQFPGAMLRARAIAEVVRMGAPEAVMGMEYAREEVEQFNDRPAAPAPGGLGAALRSEPTTLTAEQVAVDAATSQDDTITPGQLKKMGALMREVGVGDRETALAYVKDVIGREVSSRNDLDKSEAGQVIDALEADRDVDTITGEIPDADS